ncbi:TRAP transporter small permease [Neptuniibacter caesariensis]|uniref:TRAP transporter small permease protein n=1 Tax=Neptuniibacter caesariensis TaxID=207954 RepID=A0A7U8C4X0_NEPCE|nr:TRAP transporter small permease [Neptuniibacter caesariensis]EAR61638.1 putative membrane protein [Oceanospirillum sp. MED92] [Neptuniibacter caesariensis]
MHTIKRYFYLSSAILSGSCLVIMTLLILAQIAARFFGVIIPSSEDFAGWLLSATIFFGLAYTFHTDSHIRVTILLSRLRNRTKQIVEFFNLTAGILITGYLAYYTSYTAYESYIYEDVSDTYLAVPLWIVQIPMALGSVFLAISVVDSFIQALKGEAHEEVKSQEELLSSME